MCFKALLLFSFMNSQNANFEAAFYEGIVIAGYVNEGGFLNFTGPNINATYGDSKFILGMLPSLRFKKDQSVPKNAFITPNLGVGLTYSYKWLAFQLPLYYNTKTSTENGRWHLGFGIGLRLNELHFKK
jgi:hypothetical protein